MAYCINCGTMLADGARFCQSCGMRVVNDETAAHYEQNERKKDFSVKTFKARLLSTEDEKKKRNLISMIKQYPSKYDETKLELIKSFPVPQDADELKELIVFAMANIDTKYSARGVVNELVNMLYSVNVDLAMQKNISDAWVTKMQQAFNTIESLYSEDTSFDEIRRMYYEKLTALNMQYR
jgi:uncharacterized Zn finger protein (UPF0148 family)